MKKIFMLFIISVSTVVSYGQCPTDNDFIEIRIRRGVTIYGSMSVKLTYEGLIYSWLDENWKANSYFVSLDSLNNEKLCNLQNYVWGNRLMDLEETDLTPLDSNMISFDGPKIIVFFDYRQNSFKSLNYYRGDDRIIKLISMLTDLIPKEHSDFFKRIMLR
ncbi:MAG: hypothetical protein PHT69_05310 [Bacteroidales bacterium]|nr:hypothetical protein [Bacteroidales bacterium]